MKTYKYLLGCVFLFAVYFTVLSDTCFTQNLIAGKEIKTTIWNNQEVQYVDREIAVKLKKGFSTQHIQSELSKYRSNIKQDFDELGWGWIELPQGRDIFSVIDSLKKLPMIETVEPNFVTRIHLEPNDPYFKGTSPATYRHQWGMHNIGQTPPTGTNDADIDAPSQNFGSINFKDPWLVDVTDSRFYDHPYGYRNLGMDAPFKTESSPFYPTTTSKYKGVFLNQGGEDPNNLIPPYYAVRVPLAFITAE